MSEILTSIGSPTEVKEQIEGLLGTERIGIFVQDEPETYVIVDSKQKVQIIDYRDFIIYQGIPVLRINHGWHDSERVFIKEGNRASLVIQQYQTIESALWYVVILAMEILNPEAPRKDVTKIAETLIKDHKYVEEMKYLLATNARIKGDLNDRLPLAKLILSNQ